MQVRHRLPRVVSLIDHKPVSVFQTEQIGQRCDPAQDPSDQFAVRFRGIGKIFEMLSRNREKVIFRLRVDIPDDNKIFVFVNDNRFQLSADEFTE